MMQSQQQSGMSTLDHAGVDFLEHQQEPNASSSREAIPALGFQEDSRDSFHVIGGGSRLPMIPLATSRCAVAISEDDHASEASSQTVLQRIEDLIIASVIEPLDEEELVEPPSIDTKSFFHATHCRALTSIFMVASFCHSLLQSHRTTTTREVYYFCVTHFRNQAECDKTIWDLSAILQVPRSSLGLAASPKGWFCGCLDLYNANGELILNGRELDVHGMAITSTTHKSTKTIRSEAKCILVIEKEGVYTRLSKDKFFFKYYPPVFLLWERDFPMWPHDSGSNTCSMCCELHLFEENGYKVELEALNWK